VSIATAYLVTKNKSMMDYVQALFSFFIAPLFGTVLLGMLWKRATRMAGFWGLLAGVLTSVTTFTLMKFDARWVRVFCFSPLAQPLAQAMWQALWACLMCVLVTFLVTQVTQPRPDQELAGLVYSLTEVPHEEHASIFHTAWFWGALALALFVILQIIFW
jgi:solute:Na+ symporter, SSS family